VKARERREDRQRARERERLEVQNRCETNEKRDKKEDRNAWIETERKKEKRAHLCPEQSESEREQRLKVSVR